MKKNPRSLVLAAALGIATAASFTGCSTGDRSSGQYIDDRMTARRVRSELKENSIYKFDEVNVNVYRGVVQLSGWVEKPEQKQIAERIAKNTSGVLQVVNNLTLKPEVQLLMPTGESTTGQPPEQEQRERERVREPEQTQPQNP